MSSQRYQRISTTDADDHASSSPATAQAGIPSSPPPSFRSAASSPTTRQFPLVGSDPLANDADRALADSFDNDEDSEAEGEDDDRQRLMRSQTTDSAAANPRDGVQRRMTQLPTFNPTTSVSTMGRPAPSDGVFANLAAKPEVGEKTEEQPPSYEQAAADATPPYWESTVMVPGMGSDDIYIDGLPVGSVFAFLWNGMISMSFQVVGFLLTYLLHTTHAAKNGSRAGLGITMIQYGFYMKGTGHSSGDADAGAANTAPPEPNSHDFSTAAVDAALVDTSSNVNGNDILAYAMMVVGWFILIRAVSDFLRARHMKAVVMQTPDRGLGVAVVGEGETAETAV